MPRYRKLHVKVVESFDVNDMPDDFTRLTWVLLPLALCRDGRGLFNDSWLRSKLYPLRSDVTLDKVSRAMLWFNEHHMIQMYQADGRDYFYVPSFHKYQGNTTAEKLSDYPPPPALPTEQEDELAEPVESSPSASEELVTSSPSVADEPVESSSTTDSILNIQYSTTDSERSGGEKMPPPPPPPSKPAKKPKKPIPPAVRVFQDAAHRFPAKSWYATVASVVGEDEADLDFWHRVVKNYVGCGWNPINVKTMLEFYRRREIPTVGKQRKKQPGQFTGAELEKARRESLAEEPINVASFLGEEG